MAALVVAVSANAQDFNKNDWFLNARISGLELSHTFVDGASATTFDFGFGGGYFFADKFAIDAMLGVGIIEDLSVFTLGAGVRYYPVGNLFARVGYDGTKVEDLDFASMLGLTIGYDWFLTEKVFFEPGVYYKKNLADGGANQIGLSLGLGVKF